MACWGKHLMETQKCVPVSPLRSLSASTFCTALRHLMQGIQWRQVCVRCFIRPDETGRTAEPDGKRSHWGSLGTRIPVASLSLQLHCVCFKCGTLSSPGERGLIRMDYLMLCRNQPNSCADVSLGHMFFKCPLQILFPSSPY